MEQATTQEPDQNLDLDNLGDAIFGSNPDNHVNMRAMREFWKNLQVDSPGFDEMKEMHEELFDLVEATDFLTEVASVRREQREDSELDAHEVLPSEY